ncbi:MAG: hypothetical protein ACJA09_002110 [Alcanivorax sp.]|jgi:hypothetical protein
MMEKQTIPVAIIDAVQDQMRNTFLIVLVASFSLIAGCKQPLAIVGEGDIIELESGVRGCAWEEFSAAWTRCTDNDVLVTETAVYRALARPGWRFSHWEGVCVKDSPEQDCQQNYNQSQVNFWDGNFPGLPVPTLTAVFIEDNEAPRGTTYTAARFGAQSNFGFAALLDALFFEDGSYRFTIAQATTRQFFDRNPEYFERQPDGLLGAGPTLDALVAAGGATSNGDFLALVDSDSSDNDVSVTYLQPQRSSARESDLNGNYFCGHVMSDGRATFFRAQINGSGGGTAFILEDRQGRSGQTAISYNVAENGTTTFDYLGMRLAGSLSADGSVLAATQVSARLQGSAMCLRSLANKTVASVAGGYYGAWFSTQPISAVSEIVLDNQGQTAEVVLRDSLGGRNYSLGQDFMLVKATGELKTSDSFGSVSADGRILFLVNTNPNKFPTFIAYVRKT